MGNGRRGRVRRPAYVEEVVPLEVAYETAPRRAASSTARLAAHAPAAVAGWRRHHVRGERAAGAQAGFHLTKRPPRPVKPA
jgi:hypothetical protein